MARSDDAQRDLIFGLLALQNGMVTRDQLVAAFGVYTASARPMSDVLVEQGALTPHRREVLEALAAEHLAVHGGDPGWSLAALEVASSDSATLPLAAVADDAFLPGRLGTPFRGGAPGTISGEAVAAHWRRVCAAFLSVVRHDPADRAAHLEAACEGDASLRADVERLLAVEARARHERPLEVPGRADQICDAEGGETIISPPMAADDASDDGVHRFRVLRPHARGGLGVVFVALDRQLNREVALKQIRDENADDPINCGRFLREAEITGRLEHPSIVPVYSYGRLNDGKPFYAMRLIRGITMSVAIARFHLDREVQASPGRREVELRKLLGRFLAVCDAVAYAHGRGVLHRDLKPNNVMLGEYGETLVVDWGLAKAIGYREPPEHPGQTSLQLGSGNSSETQAGTRLGTFGYLSPEQAAGRLDDLGPASDVYSLGATLYVLLTGVPPQTERDIEALVARLERGEITPPRRIKPWIDPALEKVCLKAMAPRPEDRYPSARALAEDLQNWLADEPVSAWREPPSRRIGRWAKRHRTPVTAVLVSTVLFLMGLLYLLNESKLRRAQRQATAEGRVAALLTAEVQEMPRMIAELSADRPLVRGSLRSHAAEDRPPRHRLAASLALLPEEPTRAGFLIDWALAPQATPEEVLVIRGALATPGLRPAGIEQRLVDLLGAPEPGADVKLRAAGLLAILDAGNACWPDRARSLAQTLARESPLRIDAWRRVFQPVARHLTPPLLELLADGETTEADDRAFALLLAWARVAENPRRPEDIAALMAESEPPRLIELIRSIDGPGDRDRAVAALTSWVRTAAQGEAGPARRQGRIAAALLRLGELEAIWPLLRQVPDSGTRAEIIELFPAHSADPGPLIRRLAVEKDVSARRAEVLALGNYPPNAIPAGQRAPLEEDLLRWYREDPDAGLHGALGWLLRQVWGLGPRLDRVDREIASDSIPADRDWFVSRGGGCFTIIRGPVTFRVGSSKPAAPDGTTDETQYDVRIPRSYAIASTEVMMGEYLRYLDEKAEKRADIRDGFMFSKIYPFKDCAAGMVNWYNAADYCNWLSKREGIPEDQWCYPRRCEPGMTLPPDHLERVGYRLPTEAEWEYGCKAGSILAPRPFGHSDAMVGAYACFGGNSGGSMGRVGRKKPNDLGLFDMLGNAYEWCLAGRTDPPPRLSGPAIEDRLVTKLVSEELPQVMRGGAYNNPAADIRTARHIYVKPSSEFQPMGFRVVRTCPIRR